MIPESMWDACLGRSGNRLVVTHDGELGTIAAVIAPDGTVLSTGAATDRHVNHDCIVRPVTFDNDEKPPPTP